MLQKTYLIVMKSPRIETLWIVAYEATGVEEAAELAAKDYPSHEIVAGAFFAPYHQFESQFRGNTTTFVALEAPTGFKKTEDWKP